MRARCVVRSWKIVVAVFAVAQCSGSLFAQDAPRSPEELLERISVSEKASSSRSTRKEATDALPLSALNREQQAKVRRVINSVDMFRRLPALTFEVNPTVYRYFAHHPDVAVSIWRSLNVSNYDVRQIDATHYQVKSDDGTTGGLEILYRDDHQQLVLCDGEFTSPILKKKIGAQALLHLVSRESMTPDGRLFMTHRIDMFATFPSQNVGIAARLAKPVSNIVIDKNFQEISLFVQMMSLSMIHQPDWVEKLANGLDGVQAKDQKELVDLTARVFVGHQERLKREASRVASEPNGSTATR